jgi:hypothetical protein
MKSLEIEIPFLGSMIRPLNVLKDALHLLDVKQIESIQLFFLTVFFC